jgi:hypothetical protein
MGPSIMIASGDAMRSGRVSGPSQGRTNPGMRRFDTENPHRPAFGFAPRPVAPSSRISPPDPVAAPGKGEMAVGWLCVSTFISVCVASARYPYTPVSGSGKNRRTTRPSMTAALSL